MPRADGYIDFNDKCQLFATFHDVICFVDGFYRRIVIRIAISIVLDYSVSITILGTFDLMCIAFHDIMSMAIF